MKIEDFQQASRQSVVGVLVVFSQLVYKFFKALWALFAAFLISKNLVAYMPYIILGLVVLAVLGLGYSYVYYRKFIFYLDVDKEEFVLEKGVFNHKTLNVPFGKIQQVNLKRNLVQRMAGVYSLQIDTAGSEKAEIDIGALEKEKAEALMQLLVKFRDRQQPQTSVEPSSTSTTQQEVFPVEEEVPTEWSYHLSLTDLFKIGLSGNYLRGGALVLAFVFTAYDYVSDIFGQVVELTEEQMFNYWFAVSGDLMLLAIAAILIFILSFLVTLAEIFIKYFNLKITQNNTRMEIEMGLRENKKVSFQPRRLQIFRIKANYFQRKLDLYELSFYLASKKNNLDDRISTPGIANATVEKIKHFLYGSSKAVNQRIYQPNIAWFWRRLNFVILVMAVWVILLYTQSTVRDITYYFLAGGGLVAASLIGYYQWLLYKKFSIEISDEFLKICRGKWTRHEQIIELYKIEGISIKQPIWYRKRAIYNLQIHTAGGDVWLRAVPKSFLKEVNFTLFKIESAHKAWM